MKKQNLQQYLEKKYPTKKQKEQVREINAYQLAIEEKKVKLSGKELDLSEYPNLEKIEIDGKNDLEKGVTSLNLGSKPKLRNLYCPNNALTNLDLTGCPNLEVIICDGNQLTELKLGQLKNLAKLDCENNKIKELNIQECLDLKDLKCSDNFLTNLDLSNNKKIEVLKIRDNNFTEQDLFFLSHLANLKLLWIDNIKKERIEEGIYNHFVGSLEFLSSMNKLRDFRFSNTDLDSGLEYLPESLQRLECMAQERPDSKIKFIEQELGEYGNTRNRNKLDNSAHLLPIWREFNSPAREWLDKEYPEDGICLGEFDNKKNKGKARMVITDLDISKQELKKGLKLKGFIDLKKLNCSENQLTNLDLNDCQNLVELNISSNEFHDLNFLKSVNKLEKFCGQNNQKLLVKNLNFLTPLTELKELDISDSTLRGGLKPLENLSKLEKISVSRTNVNEGLEYLPENCKEIYCDLDYHSGSVEIAKKLSKFSEGEEGNHTKYNLVKWREDKQNNLTASVIPLERLFVIRSNIKKFVNKWGEKDENNLTELGKLQSPKEFSKYQYIGSAKWIARAGAVTGGILALSDNAMVGGGLAAAFPFVEVVVSQLEERLYDAKEKKWEEFINDTENFLDNYHELLGILEQIKKNELGIVNQALNDLRTKTKVFLKEYDGDSNGTIDISELIKQRKQLGIDLSKEKPGGGGSQLDDVLLAIKELEQKVTNYRQGTSSTEEEKKEDNKNNEQLEMQEDSQDNFFVNIDIWEDYNQETEENKSRAESITDDNSSSPILDKSKESLSTGKSFRFTNLTKRRKSLNNSQSNELSNQEVYELGDLQNQEQQAQILQEPYGIPGASKKY